MARGSRADARQQALHHPGAGEGDEEPARQAGDHRPQVVAQQHRYQVGLARSERPPHAELVSALLHDERCYANSPMTARPMASAPTDKEIGLRRGSKDASRLRSGCTSGPGLA